MEQLLFEGEEFFLGRELGEKIFREDGGNTIFFPEEGVLGFEGRGP